MPMYNASCSQCSYVARARTRTKMLAKMRKHIWKQHRSWMVSRIKAGKRSSDENPSVQDFVSALQSSPREAIRIYKSMAEKQYRYTKRVMDAIESLLSPEMRIAWKAVEAIHDEF